MKLGGLWTEQLGPVLFFLKQPEQNLMTAISHVATLEKSRGDDAQNGQPLSALLHFSLNM